MTKKMLAVALMASSVLVLAGCNKTPVEPEVAPVVEENMEVMVDEETMPVVEVEAEAIPVEEEVASEMPAEEAAPVVVEQPVVETEVVAAE